MKTLAHCKSTRLNTRPSFSPSDPKKGIKPSIPTPDLKHRRPKFALSSAILFSKARFKIKLRIKRQKNHKAVRRKARKRIEFRRNPDQLSQDVLRVLVYGGERRYIGIHQRKQSEFKEGKRVCKKRIQMGRKRMFSLSLSKAWRRVGGCCSWPPSDWNADAGICHDNPNSPTGTGKCKHRYLLLSAQTLLQSCNYCIHILAYKRASPDLDGYTLHPLSYFVHNYKLHDYVIESVISLLRICLAPISYLKSHVFCAMENQKRSFKDVVCSNKSDSPDQRTNSSAQGIVLNNTEAPLPTPTNTTTNQTPTLTYLQKITKIANEAQKFKDSSLMGRIFGDPIELSKLRKKLRSEWRNLNGAISLFEKTNNWFEINFSNPIDLKQIWEGRPYHIHGQLLLLRPWTPTFDPNTENTTKLDLWIRIPQLPSIFACPEGLVAIFEKNNFGEFIRTDPKNENRSGVHFSRICASVNVAEDIPTSILIPNPASIEEEITHKVWFEDFSAGCGNCGLVDHLFPKCPLRNPPLRKFQITFKEPQSDHQANNPEQVPEGWTQVMRNTPHKDKDSQSFGNKPYLNGKGGVSISFKMPEVPQNLGKQPMETQEANSSQSLLGTTSQSPKNQKKAPTRITISSTTPQLPPEAKDDHKTQPSSSNLLGNVVFMETMEKLETFLEEDDLLEEELLDIDFSEKGNTDLPINEDLPVVVGSPMYSANSIESLHTNSSFIKMMTTMEVKTNEMSTSDSLKRKGDDGDDDTASSNPKRSRNNNQIP